NWYASFYERHAQGATTMLASQPRVFLVPGLGCVAAGPDAAAARQRLELAAHAHRTVAATRDAFSGSSWLDDRELFEFDYWRRARPLRRDRRRRPQRGRRRHRHARRGGGRRMAPEPRREPDGPLRAHPAPLAGPA